MLQPKNAVITKNRSKTDNQQDKCKQNMLKTKKMLQSQKESRANSKI